MARWSASASWMRPESRSCSGVAFNSARRSATRLCAGQTLLCRALALKVPDWNARPFDPDEFYLEDAGLAVGRIVRTTRLGIPKGRDEDLPYRFVEAEYARYCTQNPLRRGRIEGQHYTWCEE